MREPRPITVFLTEQERARLDAAHARLAAKTPPPPLNTHLNAWLETIRARRVRSAA